MHVENFRPSSSLRALLTAVAIASVLVHGPARADEDDRGTRARALYDKGAEAYDAHDYLRAARLFADADELVPNAVVLKLALGAVVRTDNAVLGVTLARRADERSADAAVQPLARAAMDRFSARVGYVRVVCRDNGPCSALVDGRKLGGGQVAIVPAGPVTASFTEVGVRFRLDVPARATVELTEPPAGARTESPAPEPPPSVAPARQEPSSPLARPAEAGGLPTTVFFTAGAITLVVAGAAVVSAFDTKSKHDDYSHQPTPGLRSSGESAQLRTNVLLAAAGGTLLVTAAIGFFFTQWTSRPKLARLAPVISF